MSGPQTLASLALELDTRQFADGLPILDAMGAKAQIAEKNAHKLAAAFEILAKAGKDRGAEVTLESLSGKLTQSQRDVIRFYDTWTKAAQQAEAAAAKAAQAATPSGIYNAAGIKSPADTAAAIEKISRAQRQLNEDHAAGIIVGTQYSVMQDQLTAKMNLATEGNSRHRNALRQTAAAMASLAFEAAGAAFLVTAVVGAIAAPVLPGVGLMRTVEDTRLGMAAILVSMGRINGAAPNLPTALSISSGMMDKLVNDSMRFGVSIEALANTLRSTLAPGLAAGMSLKQIQEIATIGTIAVKTIGLDSKQTVQEIRDLVAGGIQAASSTLATSIGIKDSDIKRWREAGTLYEELMKKLQGFASASEESTKTLTGAWEVLKTKIALLMSDESGFGALKSILLGVSNYIGQIDEKTKKMVFNPALVESAKAYWELLKSIGAVLKQIGAIIEILSPAIGGFAKAAASEFGKVASILDGLIGKSATWESRMIAAAKALLNLSSLPGVAKAMSDVAAPGASRGPQSSGLITGLPQAGEVTGDLSATGNKMRDELLVGLKHTREGLQAEYDKIIQNTVSFERNLKMRRVNLQIQSAEPRAGKAAEDYAVNYAAELSAIVKGEATLASAKTEARRSLNEKLAALDNKENRPTDAYLASIQTINGLYKEEEKDSAAHLKVLADQHRTALLGDIGYENQRYAEELHSLANRKALRTQEMQNAEKAKQPVDAAKRLSEIEQINSQVENAGKVHDSKLLVIADKQQRDLDRIELGGVKARGDLVGTYEIEFGLKNLSDQKRHQADLLIAQQAGDAEWIAREEAFLADLAAARAAGLGAAQFDQVKIQFDAALSEMQAALARVKLAAEQDGGLAAAVNAQGLAKDITDKAIPALTALQQTIAGLAPTGDAGRAKAVTDDIAKVATETMKMQSFANATAKAWVSAGDSIANSLTKAFGAGGKAVGDMVKAAATGMAVQTKLDSEYAAAKKRGDADLGKQAIKYQNDTAQNTIGAYGNMAGAAASYFDKQSTAYKVLHGIEVAMFTMKFAMQATAMVQDLAATGASVANSGIRATADGIAAFAKTLASLPFPYNLVAGAVVVGSLAAMGVAISGASGGGAPSVSNDAFSAQKANEGTGTVLGDAKAQSESIVNSLSHLESMAKPQLTFTSQMVSLLKSINSALAGTTQAILSSGFDLSGANFTGSATSSGGGIMGAIFGSSSSSTSLSDLGIAFAKQTVAEASRSLQAQTYQVTRTDSSSSGFLGFGSKSSTSYGSSFSDLDAKIGDSMSVVIRRLVDAVSVAGKQLGATPDQLSAMQNVDSGLGKVSLKDKTGAEVQQILSAVFSAMGDSMALAVLPSLEKYQQAGEGALETLSRVAATNEYVTVTFKSLGMSLNLTGAAAVDASMAMSEAMGGVEKMTVTMQDYYDNFYSDSERLAIETENLKTAFAALNVAMPATRDDFRRLVGVQDLSTESGRAMTAALLGLNGAFAAVVPAAEAAADAVANLAAAALDSAMQAASDAMSGVTRAVSAEKDRLTAVYDAQIVTFNAQLDTVSSSVGKLQTLASSLKSTLDGMRISGSGPEYRAAAQSDISAALALARSGGGLPLGGQLTSALATVSKPSEQLFSTFQDYARDFYKTANDIAALGEITGQQLTVDEITQSLLKDQLRKLSGNHDAEMLRLDAIVTNAQKQLDAANGINTSVLSVVDALAALSESISALAAQRSSAASGSAMAPYSVSDSPALRDQKVAAQNKLVYSTSDSPEKAAAMALYASTHGGANTDQYNSALAGIGGSFAALGWDGSMAGTEALRAKYSFAVGTNSVPYDMTADIHADERIIPAADNRELMARLRDPQANNDALIAEIRALREEVSGLRAEAKATAGHTAKTSRLLDRAMPDGDALATRVAA